MQGWKIEGSLVGLQLCKYPECKFSQPRFQSQRNTWSNVPRED